MVGVGVFHLRGRAWGRTVYPPTPLPLEVEDPQELDPNCDTYVDHPTDVPYFLPVRSPKPWAIGEEALIPLESITFEMAYNIYVKRCLKKKKEY